jgi:hypothetical protein
MTVNYGSKRTVVGASYGFKDWLSQRATAVLMALFTVLVLVRFLLIKGPVSYESWAGIFAPQWMKVIRYLHGLHQAREYPPVFASGHHRVFGGLRRLGDSSAVAHLISSQFNYY